jgi:hypothetical protein
LPLKFSKIIHLITLAAKEAGDNILPYSPHFFLWRTEIALSNSRDWEKSNESDEYCGASPKRRLQTNACWAFHHYVLFFSLKIEESV